MAWNWQFGFAAGMAAAACLMLLFADRLEGRSTVRNAAQMTDVLMQRQTEVRVKGEECDTILRDAFAETPALGYFFRDCRKNDTADCTWLELSYQPWQERNVYTAAHMESVQELLANAMCYGMESLDVVYIGGKNEGMKADLDNAIQNVRSEYPLARAFVKEVQWQKWTQPYAADCYYHFTWTYSVDTALVWEKNAETECACQKMAQGLYAAGFTPCGKALLAHDALTASCTFASAYDENTPYLHTAFGAFCEGRAVCDGFAEAYAMLMQCAGIPCRIVSGYLQEGTRWTAHAWNLVWLDGKWYHVDVTWDTVRQTHSCFLCSDAEMAMHHSWNRKNVPTAEDSAAYESVAAELQTAFGKVQCGIQAFDRCMTEEKRKGFYSRAFRLP